jgi:hypothetical protein
MRSRSTVTAALALAAVTILAVAACGSTVSGSAAVNTAAAVSVESSTSASSQSTESTESTQSTETADQTTPTALPTDLSELTALLSGLPTDLSLPSDLSDLSDLSIPSDLGDLNIPGYNPACVTVALAYGSILLATYPALLGGDGAFDATGLQKAISDLSGQAPPEIAGDIQALGEVASEANGKTLTEVSELFDGDKFKTASDHIEAWTNTNCGG